MPFLAPSPARLPPFSLLLNNQTEPQAKVARHLGVSLRTLQRYKARDYSPRSVYLTLWFESRWGMSALQEKAFNEAVQARGWVASMERECERLKRVIRVLEKEQEEGAAANRGVYRAL